MGVPFAFSFEGTALSNAPRMNKQPFRNGVYPRNRTPKIMNSGNHASKPVATPNILHQLDLTTGYHAIHRIDTLSQPLINHYRMLLPHGGIVPIFAGQFNVSINGPRFTLFYKDIPIQEGGTGIGCDSTWRELTGLIRGLGWHLEAKPRDGLWVAEVPLTTIYELKEEPINWVFDFVCHLAVAMFTSDSNGPV
jgi:hypothetical protein